MRKNENANDSDTEMEIAEPVKKKMKGSPPYDDKDNYYANLHDGEDKEEEVVDTMKKIDDLSLIHI